MVKAESQNDAEWNRTSTIVCIACCLVVAALLLVNSWFLTLPPDMTIPVTLLSPLFAVCGFAYMKKRPVAIKATYLLIGLFFAAVIIVWIRLRQFPIGLLPAVCLFLLSHHANKLETSLKAAGLKRVGYSSE